MLETLATTGGEIPTRQNKENTGKQLWQNHIASQRKANHGKRPSNSKARKAKRHQVKT